MSPVTARPSLEAIAALGPPPVVAQPEELYQCQDCGKRWPLSQLKNVGAIPGIFERVGPGEIMPHGECPECGALCHEIEPPTIDRSAPAFRQGQPIDPGHDGAWIRATLKAAQEPAR